jgi:hypothetical protein
MYVTVSRLVEYDVFSAPTNFFTEIQGFCDFSERLKLPRSGSGALRCLIPS